jgi:(1->4)-alpha-D-glucan 1-alpha-D-glucosylmutase
MLLVEPPPYLQHRRRDWVNWVMKWQQLTGPVMAKGLEDTAFYLYNPLVSLNDVGGDPIAPETYFGVEEFHRRMHERRARWPFTLNAGSTHDTKRSEDARARINVLSEIPQEWNKHLKRWHRLNSAEDAIPDRNEETLIYQSMLGAWPIDTDRFKTYVTKALREAKVHTSWLNINATYERRVLDFVDRIFDPFRSGEFLEDFLKVQKKVSFYGAISSLSQTVLRITAPGVPDFYQGQEVWDYSLADPDNRRPVDFAARIRMLQEVRDANLKDLVNEWPDGRVKMFVIWKTLNFRRRYLDLFLRGEYIPLRVIGARADHLVAFARRYRKEWAITIVPRLVTSFTRTDRWPLGLQAWIDSTVECAEACPTEWTNIFTGEKSNSPILAAQVFGTLPVAVLHGTT